MVGEDEVADDDSACPLLVIEESEGAVEGVEEVAADVEDLVVEREALDAR